MNRQTVLTIALLSLALVPSALAWGQVGGRGESHLHERRIGDRDDGRGVREGAALIGAPSGAA